MNQNLWEMIVNINKLLNPLRETDDPSIVASFDLVELRAKLRNQLEFLRTAITEQYSERDAYFVLFPLTAHCDEIVKKRILDISQLEWPSLQLELYQMDDAGDLFYELLDTALKKPETLPLVYEVYYFCLHDGFCGRYSINPDRLNDYLEKLRSHIHLQVLEAIALPTTTKVIRRIDFRIMNYVYYGGACLFLLLLYFFLIFQAGYWQPEN